MDPASAPLPDNPTLTKIAVELERLNGQLATLAARVEDRARATDDKLEAMGRETKMLLGQNSDRLNTHDKTLERLTGEVALVGKELARMEAVNEKLRDLDDEKVSLVDFKPVKSIVYGLVAAILLGFLGLVLFAIGWKP